ncbi:hypothetical protein SAMN04488028_110126 [Reichenbachiella agariperforans]|uniref:Uncharacterized protein n=1 Tax=Reichenbachiella agariperforans TaxID=156994 RepID=A0A1M6W4R9_REIAG|nr:hypothetical protein [Reichenbachiella agariperforans]SHK88754.1 hypothetical protein SAMN04488028_110126 [Reichenbachiella agariperforans]
MSKDSYDALLPEIEAISDADTKIPNMPIDKYAQEAANLEVWSLGDIPELTPVGVPQSTFDALPARTGALRHAQSVWMKDRYGREEARHQWDTESPLVIKLKNELEHAFRYGFRKRPDLLAKVQVIEEGTGNEDLVQDLSDLSVLGKNNLDLLTSIGVTAEKLDEAATKSAEMSALLAATTGEAAENNSAKILRDKAYTLLKQAVDEIRAAGKFVFWKDAKRLKGYRSAYHSR